MWLFFFFLFFDVYLKTRCCIVPEFWSIFYGFIEHLTIFPCRHIFFITRNRLRTARIITIKILHEQLRPMKYRFEPNSAVFKKCCMFSRLRVFLNSNSFRYGRLFGTIWKFNAQKSFDPLKLYPARFRSYNYI